MELDELKYLHENLSAQIAAEFELLGQRMTWLLTSNSFLFTASAISAGTLSTAAAGPPSNRLPLLPLTIALVVPLLGIVLCCLSAGPMCAARTVIRKWKDRRQAIESQLCTLIEFRHPLTIDADYHGHKLGNLPYKLNPWIFAAAWAAVLIATALHAAIG